MEQTDRQQRFALVDAHGRVVHVFEPGTQVVFDDFYVLAEDVIVESPAHYPHPQGTTLVVRGWRRIRARVGDA